MTAYTYPCCSRNYEPCIATMIAAQLFNQRQGTVTDEIYGAVTTGTDWKFLKLYDRTIYIDKNDYFIKEVDKILGILTMTLRSKPDSYLN